MKTGTPTEFWMSPEGREALVVLEMVFRDVARREVEACDHPVGWQSPLDEHMFECLKCGVRWDGRTCSHPERRGGPERFRCVKCGVDVPA